MRKFQPAQVDERLYLDETEVRRRKKLRRLRRYLVVMTLAASIIFAMYVVIFSPVFQIKEITVMQPGEEINEEKLTHDLESFFAGQNMMSAILGSNNILAWDTKTKSFLAQNPHLAALTVLKDYPQRNIRIAAEPRKKYGIWCQQETQNNVERTPIDTDLISVNLRSNLRKSASSCWWFDGNGILFEEAPKASGTLITKVRDTTNRYLNIGDAVLDKEKRTILFALFEIIDKSKLGTKTFRLEQLEREEITAQRSNLTVRFSLRIDPQFTAAILKDLHDTISFENIESIDLRVENRVYYTLK